MSNEPEPSPLALLEITDSLREEASTSEKDEVGHGNGESAGRQARSEGVEADKKSADEANNRSDANECSELAERDTAEMTASMLLRKMVISGRLKSTQRPAQPSLSPKRFSVSFRN